MTTPPTATPSQGDILPGILAGLLFILLLLTVREILIPPVILPFVIAACWPLRRHPGGQLTMVTASALTLIWALHLYGGLLGPFVLAIAVAYLIAPVVAKLEKRRAPRGVAIVLVAVPPLALLAAIGAVALPELWEQASTLIHKAPQVADTISGALTSLRLRIESLPFLTAEQRTIVRDFDAQRIAALVQQNGDEILQRLGAWGWQVVQQVGTVFGFLAYIVITPVVAFYLLRDWPGILRALESVIPPGQRGKVVGFLSEYDDALGRFVRGQLLEATLVGLLTTAGLAILGVPSPILIGLIAGIGNLIPYVGFVLALAPALLVALAMPSPGAGLLRVVAVFAVVQFIDGNVTGPRIVGDSVGLHPVVIMLALALGGAVLGFVGLVLAVPIAVLLKMVGGRIMARYRGSEVYAAGT